MMSEYVTVLERLMPNFSFFHVPGSLFPSLFGPPPVMRWPLRGSLRDVDPLFPQEKQERGICGNSFSNITFSPKGRCTFFPLISASPIWFYLKIIYV